MAMWKKGANKAAVRDSVQKTVASTILTSYKTIKKVPDDFYRALLENNTTHFTGDELERLLAAFKRITTDRLQASHFYEIIEAEMGWSNLLLRKQLFKAFDFDALGDINFTEFAEGYSTMLRGTVPEMLEFAWRVYHIQGPMDLLALTDVYTVLRLALAGLEEVRRKQGSQAGGSTEDTRFPERTARQMLENILGDRQAPLTKEEFNQIVLRHRRLVDCIIPGFELIPQDPLHRAAEAGEAIECQHLLEVDLLDVDGRDAMSFPTTPLHLAVRYGHAEVTAVLLNKGANMRLQSADGDTAIDEAVKYGRMRVLELLLEAGVDVVMPSRNGNTAFHTASYYGQFKALRTLMAYLECTVTELRDRQGQTPLNACAKTDNWVVIDIFIEYDKLRLVDIDATDNQGCTALHTAVQHSSFRVARKLIELGADVSAVDFSNRSVLNAAVRVKGNEASVNLLLSNERCQVDRADDNGVTPLKACIPTEDAKILRALLAHQADANVAEHGTGLTPLHQAVLQRWLEGVDAMLAPGVDCKILRDVHGCTALDYARTQEVFELLRDYVENLYPMWMPDHPVDFVFGIIFDEGAWKLQTEGDLIGLRILKRPKVSKAVASKRMEHKMIDKASIKKQLRKAGLVVLEEQVRVQEHILGMLKGDIRQFSLLRIGVPLYRLQQEAMKMRIQMMRTDFGKREDFYIDEENYPHNGFQSFTLGERQKVLLNIVQSTPTNESLLAGSATGSKLAKDPYVAGISVSHYIKYEVIHDFTVLHEPRMRNKVMQYWNIKQMVTKRFWRTQLLDYLTESKNNEFTSLQLVLDYFGHKLAFYVGFLSYYTNWLIAPAIAGIFTFCLEFIPSEYDSQIEDSPEDKQKFDDQYDHPLMFVYAFFIAVWCALVTQGWNSKSKELAFRWQVDDDATDTHTPNPLSTAPVRLQFVEGSWQYRAVLTPSQKAERMRVAVLVTLPCMTCFILLSVASAVAQRFLDDAIDSDCDLFRNCGQVDQEYNAYGELAVMAGTGVQAIMIQILGELFAGVAVWTCNLENHESVASFETNLAFRVIAFSLVNSYSALEYYAFYAQDIDKTAAMLGSLMICGQLMRMSNSYLVPYLQGKETAEKAMVRRGEKLVAQMKKQAAERRRKAELTGEIDFEEEGSGMLGEATGSAPDGSSVQEIYGNKPITDITIPQDNVTETFSEARDEVLNENEITVLEFAEVIIQFGYVAMFGAVWPLAALMSLLNNFFEIRFDIWKFCTFVRRPMAERVNSIGTFWTTAFETMAIVGITNHMFVLGVASNTMDEYFFPGITMWERLFASFCAQNFFLFLYGIIRILHMGKMPTWVSLKKKEPLRFIRDAYRAGCALRERRYRMLLSNPHVPMSLVCKAEDIDENAADRYLRIVRYVDDRPADEMRSLLYDSSTTIQALLTTIHLKARGRQWVDDGERPTAAGLLRELVPTTDIRECYTLGKALRESAYSIWETHKDVTVMGSKAATIMSIRQFACIEVGSTMPQAERYVRLVRYVEQGGMNPWEHVSDLQERFPRGIMQVLSAAAEEGGSDMGEPVPSELGPLIEPITLAKRAFEKADIVRRKMFERWVHDKDMQHSELLESVCHETGAFVAQLERYLLIKRYCDSLEERKRKDLLQFAKTKTLLLCSTIRQVMRDGGWRDPGEPSFYTYTPPIVVEDPSRDDADD
ncbi:hypothetical protein CYMTET_16981 [Cymbomonas tetramitiformis]|uniref:EF-hand domain-containing protein n=1 Tax=Cymbomonas tetramitiformis TaxID=36881 RepID=A0AAE0GBA6_9CHLO|nr:hypothetical protein CYMTET_16981 [Cymbomonas tetramitiformis]|eukprot:gene1042-1573_t